MAESNLLLVDDDPGTIQAMATALAGQGMLRFATSGEDARRLIRQSQPDLVMLDDDMPGLTGYELCCQLKADPLTAGIPIMFVTGNSDLQAEIRGLEAGAVDFIAKPINPPLLRARVRTHLRVKRLTEETLKQEVRAQSQRGKAEFLSRVSHEMRTPLNAIIGFAQLLQLPGPRSESQLTEFGQYIQSAGAKLLNLVEDVLTINQTMQFGGELPLVAVPLDPLVRECAEQYQDLAAARGVTLEFEAFPTLLALAEASRLRQVLSRLISNAIEYNKRDGKVKIKAHVASLAQIQLLIEDTGIGMDQMQLEKLFQPFDRLGREAANESGVGLGLVISKALLAEMNGTLSFESQPGQGTTVTVTLASAKLTGP